MRSSHRKPWPICGRSITLEGMVLTRDIGMKISPALREYYRYTGVSAEAERRGIDFSKDRDFSRLRNEEQDAAPPTPDGEACPKSD